jgi:hypothetical protein
MAKPDAKLSSWRWSQKLKLENSRITDHSRLSTPLSKQPFHISVHQSVQSDKVLEWKTQHQKHVKKENSDPKQNPQSNVTIRSCSPYGQQGGGWCDNLSDILPFVVDVSSACDVPHVAAAVCGDLLGASSSFCHFEEV